MISFPSVGNYFGVRQFGAKRALVVLTIINLLNYADRYVPSSTKTLIQADLHISDYESSLPTTGMIVVYMCFAILFGVLSDKEIIDRRIILCGAIMFWSLATSLAGLAENLVQLVALRSLVGVGEAAYTTITPAVLSDFYPYKERNIVFGIYYLAIPIGGALGFAVGAVLGSAYGWRTAFLACGAPGLIIALMVLTIDNPPRGINDRQHPTATTSITAAASESKEGARYGEISQSNKGLTASTKGLLRSPEEDEDITDVTLERYEEGKAQSTADHQGVSSYSHSRQSQQRSGNEDKTPDDGTPLDYSEGEFEAVGLVGNTSRSSVRKEEMSSQRIAVESSSSGSSSTKPLVNDASSRNKTGSLSSSKTGGIITGPGEWRYQSMSHYYGILHSEYHSLISELRVILGNRHYLFAVLGLSATTFAVGGVGEWYATFLIRYCSASINAAGLVVGAASIVGGICGTILGVKTADYFQPRVKSAYFLVSALFCIPCALFLLISINYTDNFGVSVFFLFLAQVCVWTNGGPINTISVSVIPPHQRSRAYAVLIFSSHVLGDIISPPIIGAISDSTGSLQLALQMTWMAMCVAGLWWGAAWYLLPPLPIDSTNNNTHSSSNSSKYNSGGGGEGEDSKGSMGGGKRSNTSSQKRAIAGGKLAISVSNNSSSETTRNVLLDRSIEEGLITIGDDTETDPGNSYNNSSSNGRGNGSGNGSRSDNDCDCSNNATIDSVDASSFHDRVASSGAANDISSHNYSRPNDVRDTFRVKSKSSSGAVATTDANDNDDKNDDNKEEVTYWSILFGKDPLMKTADGRIVRINR